MKNEYRREMERLGPRQAELDRLYEMIEGGTLMNRKQRLGCRAAAILVCAVLTVTAAMAAIPTVWETLRTQLGAFAPYARTIEGAACMDQGVEIQVLSALSDDLEAQVYFSVRDGAEDRLDSYLELNGRLAAGTEQEPEPGAEAPEVSFGSASTRDFQLISYNEETKTALFSARIPYGELYRPAQTARLSVTGMTTEHGQLFGEISCGSVTGATLESLPAAESDKVVFTPDDSAGLEYTGAVLPSRRVVLAPGQTPMPIEGTEDMWVSSMGFAVDGCFHVRLGFAEGVSLTTDEPGEAGFFSDIWRADGTDNRNFVVQETLVEGGMDILFPLFRAEDLDTLRDCQVRVYGPYTRSGIKIEGTWFAEFQIDYHPSVVLEWTGALAGRQVRQVTVSPLSVTMYSDDSGGFHNAVLYAVKRDGSTVAAAPGTGRYRNVGQNGGKTVWEAFNTWKFEEPVDLDDVAALRLEEETIPVDGMGRLRAGTPSQSACG